MVAALAPRPDGVSGGPESPRRPHHQPPHGLTGLRRLGADVIRRLHLRLLSPRRLGPCRGHIKGRLKSAPMYLNPRLTPWAKLSRPPRRAQFQNSPGLGCDPISGGCPVLRRLVFDSFLFFADLLAVNHHIVLARGAIDLDRTKRRVFRSS
jgi:hypothetical protein